MNNGGTEVDYYGSLSGSSSDFSLLLGSFLNHCSNWKALDSATLVTPNFK